jgi:carbon-monoxide dehydrogenase small subunit
MNGRAVNSCLVLAAQADGSDITTIEGVSEGGKLHPIQQSFVEHGSAQCGFCTPGMILSAKSLLDRNPDPSEGDVRVALAGNLCRCTGYQKIVEAVLSASKAMKDRSPS